MKSSLFLMEQLAAILIFAAFAAVCVSIFASSYAMSLEGRDINNALIIAENGAECYKAASGDAKEAARLLGGIHSENAVFAYYDENRQPCGESGAFYILGITNTRDGAPKIGELCVESVRGGQILEFSVAARGDSQ